MREDFYFDSAGKGKIHACRWTTETAPTAVVQIVHGIADHIGRYDQFARYLNGKGYLVVGEDHMGHGLSPETGGTVGYFHGGWFAAVEDTVRLLRMTREAHPGIPYILLGHSMGSFLTRTILIQYPDLDISGVILSGTAWMDEKMLAVGKAAASIEGKRIGEQTPCKVLHSLIFGPYNRKVERPRTKNDWLTRDSVIVDEYNADPLCTFIPSCGLIRDMMGGISFNQKKGHLARMNKRLPVLFVAGGDDPVGDYGRGVRRSAQEFQNAGMEDVAVRIYPLCRHEILNEINRAEVFREINIWIREKFL